jgi:membrane associated rhomboid family serine protease
MLALQIVWLISRREHVGEAPYLALLAGDLALLVYVHVTHRQVSMAAFVAESLAVVLAFAPRLLDALERAALHRDNFRRAARVALLRELVVPGRSAVRRRRQLSDLAEARSGGSRPVVRRLREELESVRDGASALLLREELATVLFFDQRFAEGVAEVEGHLGLDHVARRPAFAAYLVRAYGETGQLARAATVMALLEDGPAGRDPAAALLLVQARLTFLAFAGGVEHLEALLSSEAGNDLPERAHEFLLSVARNRAQAVAIGRAELPPPEVRALAETIFTRASLRAQEAPPQRRRWPATFVLLVLCGAVFAIQHARVATEEFGALTRMGALFRPAVLAGEWWRFDTAMFLHGGWVHFASNAYGLYLLGRFTEDIFGTARFVAIYLISGLVGGAASFLLGPAALSVGASGAIMGLLGGLIVTLVLRRGSWPEVWRRTLLINLALLGAVQIYIGFQVPNIDNAAHVGGMVGGAAATLLLAPGGVVGPGPIGRAFALTVAVALSLAVIVSGVQAARTPFSATLDRLPMHEVTVGPARLRVPAYWQINGDSLEDPYLDLKVTPLVVGGKLELQSPQDRDPRYRALFESISRSLTRAAP